MEKTDQRVMEAIKEIFGILPDRIVDFCKKINLKFTKFNNKGFGFHHLQGCVAKTCPNIIQLNYFNLEELSKDSIKAVIVHELGHSYILYNQDLLSNILLRFLTKYQKKKFEERRANQLVNKWGFGKELEKLNKESFVKIINWKNDGSINSSEELKKIKDDEKRVDIFLRCDKCDINYKIEYFYYDISCNTKVFFIKNDHSKAEVNFDFPINYKDIMRDSCCMNCESKLSIITIVKNPKLY